MSEVYKTPEKEKAYFVTFTIIEWIKILQDDSFKMIIVNAIKYYQNNRGVIIYSYCIMPNHVHLILQSNGEETVSEVLRDLKKFTSKEIIRKLKENESNEPILKKFKQAGYGLRRIKNYKVWIDGNHAKVLFSNYFIRQKVNYIHNNPVKAGIVENPVDYLFSSARNYCDLESPIDVVLLISGVITVR